MKASIVGLVILEFFVMCIGGAEDEGPCPLVDDHFKNNLRKSVCYLKCISDALNKLYTDGEQKFLVNEEVYANASRILDDMEGKTGESTKYLSAISGVIDGEYGKLEKLIFYGNTIGDLVDKVGGLFSEVNESVRAVREVLPSALIKVNKYYTAVAEITRTVWDDLKAMKERGTGECEDQITREVVVLPATCADHTCPLRDRVSKDTIQKYKDGCLAVTVQSGSVSGCFNRPRDNIYKNGVIESSDDVLKWHDQGATVFQLTVKVEDIFGPLIAPFSAWQPPSVLLTKMTNITYLYSHFNKVQSKFTSLLLDTNLIVNVNSSNSTI
uniref:Metacyclic expression site-associated (ESAG1-U1EC) n=1 Tax=Trypanosoma brucei TaxID=5691 RepID=Q26752_9TRYP|nr:expression site-associated gene product (ESAG1-U1EC) [Trypanosoma brucei]